MKEANPLNGEREVFVLRTFDFEKEVARLNKKAQRIGVPAIQITNLGKVTKTRTVVTTGQDFGEPGQEDVQRVPLDVTRYSIKLPNVEDRGWEALARITPVEGEKPFVEALQPDFDVTPWQNVDPAHCDHCNVKRYRVLTYIARNKNDGRIVQLGRKCFEDYIGKDTLAALEFLALIVCNIGGDDEGFFPRECGRGVIQIVNVATCVAMAEALYAVDGWINNVKESYSQVIKVEGTHRVAAAALRTFGRGLVGRNDHSTEARAAMHEVKDGKRPEAIENARAIIERMAQFETRDDEFANALKNIADYTSIPAQKAGLAAYMGQFLRNEDARVQREAKRATMQYRGTVGKRETFENLTCRKVFSFESDYGTTYVNIFEDADGNELVWKTGSNSYNEGQTVSLKGTVKAHEERKGAKQTVLSRCKELVLS